MDIPFDPARWRPTQPLRSGELATDPDELESLSRELADRTKDIVHHPYDPGAWVHRAETLRRLRYPELSLGDAHKATLLIRQHLQRLDEDAAGQWQLGHGMSFWMLETRSNDCALRQRLLRLQDEARKLEEKNLSVSKTDGKGKYHPQPYPWLPSQRSRRNSDLVARINQEFAANADSVLNSPPLCQAKEHAFGNTGPASKDILGVFATHDIPANKAILIDTTRIIGCCGPGSGGDHANLKGALACGDPIHPNLPDEFADLDLRWVRDETGIGATSTLLTIRLLLAAVQDGVAHPLDHPLVARFTPNYRSPEEVEPESLYLANDIDVPIRALQQFGVDVFADLNFDTWVLFTISQRQYNNVCGDSISGSLMPLFSLFNHSCEPNVVWSRFREKIERNSSGIDAQPDGTTAHGNMEGIEDSTEQEDLGGIDHGTVTVTTARDIKKGEQLFVEYDSFEHSKTVTERRRRLRKWLSGDCMCTRCVREAAEEEAEPARKGTTVEGTVKVWDDTGSVELPEDRGVPEGMKLNHW